MPRPEPATGTPRRPLEAAASRAAQVWRLTRRDGVRVVAGRAAALASDRLLSGTVNPYDVGLDPAYALAAPCAESGAATRCASGLIVNWVIPPPEIGSGGFGTIFRLVGALEARGHSCRVYIQYGARPRVAFDRGIIRDHFGVTAPVHALADGIERADGTFATSWPTAYAVRSSPASGRRLYLVQDFEPWFYPVGSRATLAEATYGFGFHGVTAGTWLAEKLATDYHMTCDHFDLGVDTACYQLDNEGRRDGVLFFARPSTPRRGFELGMLALELFARRHPTTEIHLLGQDVRWRRPPFRFHNHGTLSRTELASLYNRCSAGLVLSLTNLSLLPAELLASGCTPVMNDAVHTRAACTSPYAKFAAPTPAALAGALSDVLASPPSRAQRRLAAASVDRLSWETIGASFERTVRRAVGPADRASGPAAAVS